MDKKIIKGVLLAGLLILSCCNTKTLDKNEVIIVKYNPWITVDFQTKILRVNYYKLRYTDTIKLSQRDDEFIIDSYFKNKINELNGNVFLASKERVMPPTDFLIKIFKKQKLQCEITIDFEYESPLPWGQDSRIVSFRDNVLKILENNNEFKKALKVFKAYDSNLWKNQGR